MVKKGVNCFVFKLIFFRQLTHFALCSSKLLAPPPPPKKLLSKAMIKLRTTTIEACSQNCEQRLSASVCLSVRPYVREEQFDSHWTDFNVI